MEKELSTNGIGSTNGVGEIRGEGSASALATSLGYAPFGTVETAEGGRLMGEMGTTVEAARLTVRD
jgi:hypothetical protein